jgi:hypothetical protein
LGSAVRRVREDTCMYVCKRVFGSSKVEVTRLILVT